MCLLLGQKKIQDVGFCIAESHGSCLMHFDVTSKTEMDPYKLLGVLIGCRNAFPIAFPLLSLTVMGTERLADSAHRQSDCQLL